MPCAPRLDAPGVLHHVMLGVRRDICDSPEKKSQEPLTFRACCRRDSFLRLHVRRRPASAARLRSLCHEALWLILVTFPPHLPRSSPGIAHTFWATI